jgi:ethanolamine ammonia-lyase small subunit
LDHALARDAVQADLDVEAMVRGLRERGREGIALRSVAVDEGGGRKTYLRRPDLGRRLSVESKGIVRERGTREGGGDDVAVVIGDGLSALAVERHALAVVDALRMVFQGSAWRLGTLWVVSQARVAVGDEIGEAAGARATVMLIGERPGLSSPDSLGVYITWHPRPGRTDAERNCISNIRSEGLSYAEAAERILFYLESARRIGASGVGLRWTGASAMPRLRR